MRSAQGYLDKVKMRPADPIKRGVFTLAAIGIPACTVSLSFSYNSFYFVKISAG
jgi:hypothetical protein